MHASLSARKIAAQGNPHGRAPEQQWAELTGGGHNAFSRYENRQAAPVAAVVNLFTLLDHHPELVHELRVRERQVTPP